MFADELRTWTVTLQAKTAAAFQNACALAKSSITDGSAITGAPGQPVDTGNLIRSWILAFESPTLATITTNVVYAPIIEDGIFAARRGNATGQTRQRLTLRSAVGGFGSVKLTVAGWPRLVDAAARGVTP